MSVKKYFTVPDCNNDKKWNKAVVNYFTKGNISFMCFAKNEIKHFFTPFFKTETSPFLIHQKKI